MSWRIVTITQRAKLDFKMNFLVVRTAEGETRIYLGDISVLIIESTAVAITTYLLSQLVKYKIKVIFCDEKHNPSSELIPTYGSYISSGRIREQIKWNPELKAQIWQTIIIYKITNQAAVLKRIGKPQAASLLQFYARDVQIGDRTNREGHAAKVYFHYLLGNDFYRDAADPRNTMLDYGYTILLGCFNREISVHGYLTQIGLWHDNAANPFNLGSDLMEPFRPIIDLFVATHPINNFTTETKHQITNLLNSEITIANQTQFLNNAIRLYVNSIFTAIAEKNPTKIVDYEL